MINSESSLKLTFAQRAVEIISRIPSGKVATYGQIAVLAGNHRAARQVAWILHSSSRKHGLPWHRVVNSKGRISLPPAGGLEEQREKLEAEGIAFGINGNIDLTEFLWNVGKSG